MKSTLRCWLLPLALLACGNAGTETGNPPTRNACGSVVCAPCAPPIVVHITYAVTGGPIEGLTIEGDATACSVEAAGTRCQLVGAPYTTPGLHHIELAAEGYEPLGVDVEVEKPTLPNLCCSCGYTPTRVEVALTPLPSSD